MLAIAGIILLTGNTAEPFDDEVSMGADGEVPVLVKLMVPRDLAHQTSGVAPPPVYIEPVPKNELAAEGVQLAMQGIRDAVAEAMKPKPWPWSEQMSIEDASPLLPRTGGIVAWAPGEAVKSRRLAQPMEIDATTPPYAGMKDLLPRMAQSTEVPLDPDLVIRPDPQGLEDPEAPQSDLWQPENLASFAEE